MKGVSRQPWGGSGIRCTLALSLGSIMAISGACDGDNPLAPEDVATIEITTAPPLLEPGSGVQLAFEVRDADGNLIDPDDLRIEFSSSSPTVATVSETGLVTSVSVGTATITIGTGSVSDTVTVTVVPEISSLEIVDAELHLITDETFGFDVIVLNMAGDPVPNPVLAFTSSNPAVASVDDNGNVTGVFAGSATITVEGGGESDTIEVTVFAAMSQGILLRFAFGNSFTVQAGDELVIDNAVPPRGVPFVITDPGTELEFTTTDASVVTVDPAGLLVAHAPGEALITVTSPDDPGDSATMRLKVLEAGSVDVLEMEPATASIQLEFDPENQFPVELQLSVEVDGERITDFLPRLSSSDDTVAVVFPFRTSASIIPGQPPTARLNALVDGVAPGTVTITAQTGDLTAESVISVMPVN